MPKGSLLFLIIYFLSTSFAQAGWVLHSVRGSITAGKKSLRAGQILTPSAQLSASSGYLVLKHGENEWTLIFNENSHFTLSQVGDTALRGELHLGSVTLKASPKNLAPLVMDFADWQLRKIKGEFSVGLVAKNPGDYSLANKLGPLWLKKEVMGPATEVPAYTRFKIQNGGDVFAFEEIVERLPELSWSLKWHISAKPGKAKEGRGVATISAAHQKTFCQAPAANFEQCSWKCFGGTKQSCNTSSAQTHCVRFTCTADGQWKMPTLVSGGECMPQENRVDQCQ